GQRLTGAAGRGCCRVPGAPGRADRTGATGRDGRDGAGLMTHTPDDVEPGGPPVPRYDAARAEAAVRELLYAVGEDPERDGLRDTPGRVARMYAETFAGMHIDP